MSCQSLQTRAVAPESDKDSTHCGSQHRSVRFSSESRSSTREKHYESDRRDGSISLTALTPVSMSQSAPSNSHSFDLAQPAPSVPCRFPKLEECAHFHYERVSLGGLSVQCVPCEEQANEDWTPGEGWICLKVRAHVNSTSDPCAARALSVSWTEASDVSEWTLSRNKEHLVHLDDMLHRCIYDRKVSGLPNLSEKITPKLLQDDNEYTSLISDYVHHLSIIADDSINCGPVLNWLQMDNKGHKLLVANEDSSSINTPAVAAGYSVRKYVSQARDEISFDVGDMISIIDMPGPNESLWWRGKRGFRVGFFPRHCVAVIGDKVPRHMTQPPPIVGSVAQVPMAPVLRKHGKLISLFRSFILSRPSRRSLKQQGILRERVFGCDLGEHLLNCGHEVPLVLTECARFIESRGAIDGIYRLSGGSGLTQRLRAAFDEVGCCPQDYTNTDPHALASLLKMYFRELPNPLCTYQLYESFVTAVQRGDEQSKLKAVRQTVVKLPPPHYRTLAYLMRHLRRVSLLGEATGMTARNMAIVWAPNLLRSPRPTHALQGVAVQAVVTEFLICFAEELFAQEQGADCETMDDFITDQQLDSMIELRGTDSCRRPKSLPLHPPTKLLSLEEARRRGPTWCPAPVTPPQPSGVIASAATTQLRPQGNAKPKYIEVGSGPNNLPQYHTVLELPSRGLKRAPQGWRQLFVRKQQRQLPAAPQITYEPQDTPMPAIRPVKSCESLNSENDTLAPLAERSLSAPVKTHTRSSSCDSYFEPWALELADMRLRLEPQERHTHMFTEDDTHNKDDSSQSTPTGSYGASAEPSPRRSLRLDVEAAYQMAERRRTALEEQLASISYIDGDSPRAKPAEKRQCQRAASPPHSDIAKRLCKDRDSHPSSPSEFQTSLGNVKLRDRSSPRKGKNSNRYSGLYPLNLDNVTISVADGVTTVTDDSPKTIDTQSSDRDKELFNVNNDRGTNDCDKDLFSVNNDRGTKDVHLTDVHLTDVHLTDVNVKPSKARNISSRLSWHGKDGHSTLIKIDWPIENSFSNLTNLTTSSLTTPVTPTYDTLESDSEVSDTNKRTIKIVSDSCQNCREEKCLKCELKATDYENVKCQDPHDSLELSPCQTDISYQNLNRLSAVSTSSNSESDRRKNEENELKIMTSSHDSSSTFSNHSRNDDYDNFKLSRPSYINLHSSSTSKSSPGSPLKSPLKSTISITFRSPTKTRSYENVDCTPTNEFDRDSVYENIDLDKNLSIVEDASIPDKDANLPTPACQPDVIQDLIIFDDNQTNIDDLKNFDNSNVHNQVNIDNLKDPDVYSQVKFFRKSIDEVNAMILESPEREHHSLNLDLDTNLLTKEKESQPHSLTLESPKSTSPKHNMSSNAITNMSIPSIVKPGMSQNVMTSMSSPKSSLKTQSPKHSLTIQPKLHEIERFYENMEFHRKEYENINVDTLNLCDKNVDKVRHDNDKSINTHEKDNGNIVKTKNLNVRELATRFESPTEQTGPFIFEKFKADIKYPTLERKIEENRMTESLKTDVKPPISPKTFKLSKNSCNARSLDENAFVKEFGSDVDRRKSLEVKDLKKTSKYTPDLNLNLEESEKSQEFSKIESITPTTENKISLIQRFDAKPDIKNLFNFETEKNLSRERIERYKEERRNFLREKYSSQSFRSNPEQLTRIKIKKDFDETKAFDETRLSELPKFERRNTMDLGQRMRFSLAKSANNLDTIPSPTGPEPSSRRERESAEEKSARREPRKEKSSPSYNIRDMTAIFESQCHNG